MKRSVVPLLAIAACVFTNSTLAIKTLDNVTPTAISINPIKKSKDIYIVRTREKSLMEYAGGVNGMAATKPRKGEKIDPHNTDVQKYIHHMDSMHEEILTSTGASKSDKVYSYHYATNGFAARLTTSEVETLKNNAQVMGVYKDELLQLQTDNTPKFLGLTQRGSAWTKGWTGEDVVIGIIDTGINPEHPSFADTRTPIRGDRGRKIRYGNTPASWADANCEFGNSEFNVNDAAFDCNNKLIKAQYFVDGFGADTLVPTEFLSARDSDGHGSHTASTSAGNFGVPAYINDTYQGDISGIAPRARIAVYKVCWQGVDDSAGCTGSDSMAAIDQAVADGVDVINYSIGGSDTNFGGPAEISFLLAADANVWVATSQGNSGPSAETTGTPAGVPWITAVGASQDDSVFVTGVNIATPESISNEYLALEGSGVISLEAAGTINENIIPSIPEDGCTTLTNSAELFGNIALIKRGTCGFLDKYVSAAEAGAKAVIVYNDGTDSGRIDPIAMGGFDGSETIPGVMVSYTDGELMRSAHAARDSVTGSIGPDISISQVNRIAGFSSRGPNGGAFDIIKPDVAAPGVEILAAGTNQPNEAAISSEFINLNGTSMASPHVAGIFALLKQAHPDWSAAMAKSAIMTTARQDMKKTFGEDAADPFDIGAGHIVPNQIFEPGLVYDVGLLDYLAFSCGNNMALVDAESCADLAASGYSQDGSDLNLASIAIADLIGEQTVTRKVTSVTPFTAKYRASVTAPEGINVSVSPQFIRLRPGETASFQVTFQANADVILDEWAFGDLVWTDGRKTFVRSPIAVKPVAVDIADTAVGNGTTGETNIPVAFGYSGEFVASLNGLSAGILSAGSIEDAAVNESDAFILPEGLTMARFAMYDADVGNGAGTDDLDIQVYGPDTEDFPLVGASQGATSSETIDIVNPSPGLYIAVVFDFATAEGPTTYKLYNYNFDGTDQGNLDMAPPANAVSGEVTAIDLSWADLLANTRYLGFINYTDGTQSLGKTTEVLINTQ